MADATIDGLPTLASVDRTTDKLAIWDASDSLTAEATINSTLGFSGGNPVSTSDTQTLTNKTLGITNTVTLVDNLFTLQDNSDNTKQLQLQLSGITTGTTRTLTVPDASTTLVGTDTTQTLTNKTLTSPTINTATISNPTLTVDAISEHTGAAGVTIDGMLIKDGTVGPGTITPAGLVTGTGSSWVWQSYTATTTGITETSGTKTANYIQVGKIVFFKFRFIFGASSAITASPTITLPVTATSFYASSSGIIGFTEFVNTGVADYAGQLRLNSTTVAGLLVSGTNGISTAVSSTVPFTFGTADELVAQGFYEAA